MKANEKRLAAEGLKALVVLVALGRVLLVVVVFVLVVE